METEKRPVTISDEDFLTESLSIIEEANKKNVVLRVLGGFAVYIHSDHNETCRRLQRSLGRLGAGGPTFTDLDLGAYLNQWKPLKQVLEVSKHLLPDRMINAMYGDSRLVYFHPIHHYPIDVFFDKLQFSHVVPFGALGKNGRLELDYPTLNLADITLEKLQIHQINRKDLVDLIVLFLGHDIGQSPASQVIDGSYIAGILADDWGFWYDATNNLQHAAELLKTLSTEGKVSQQDSRIVDSRIYKLRSMIDGHEKSKRWKMRERVGASKPWYTEVSDL